VKSFFYDQKGMFVMAWDKCLEDGEGNPRHQVLMPRKAEDAMTLFNGPREPTRMPSPNRTFDLKRIKTDGLLGPRAEYEEVE